MPAIPKSDERLLLWFLHEHYPHLEGCAISLTRHGKRYKAQGTDRLNTRHSLDGIDLAAVRALKQQFEDSIQAQIAEHEAQSHRSS